MIAPICRHASTERPDAFQVRLRAIAGRNVADENARTWPRGIRVLDPLGSDGTTQRDDPVVRQIEFALGVERRKVKDGGAPRPGFGEPEEVAAFAVMRASDEAAYRDATGSSTLGLEQSPWRHRAIVKGA